MSLEQSTSFKILSNGEMQVVNTTEISILSPSIIVLYCINK